MSAKLAFVCPTCLKEWEEAATGEDDLKIIVRGHKDTPPELRKYCDWIDLYFEPSEGWRPMREYCCWQCKTAGKAEALRAEADQLDAERKEAGTSRDVGIVNRQGP